MKVRGVVKGKTIVLDEPLEMEDGERVELEVRAFGQYSGPGLYQVSVRLAPDQPDLRQKRKYEGFPTTMYVEVPVIGTELVRAIRTELGSIGGDDDALVYKIMLAHMDGPPVAPVYYKGTTCFEDAVRVPPHIYAKDLMRMMMKTIGVNESDTKIYRFNPIPKRGAKVTNELVNEIREELGI